MTYRTSGRLDTCLGPGFVSKPRKVSSIDDMCICIGPAVYTSTEHEQNWYTGAPRASKPAMQIL